MVSAAKLDSWFAFETFKMVRIEDYRLGIFHWLSYGAAVLYIVVALVFVGQGYVLDEVPQGTLSTRYFGGGVNENYNTHGTMPSKFAYCRKDWLDNWKATVGKTAKSCGLLSSTETVFPVGDPSGISLTSRVTEVTEKLACNSTQAATVGCPEGHKWEEIDDTKFFVANLEKFEIWVQHTAFAPSQMKDHGRDKRWFVSSSFGNGRLVGQKGEIIKEFKRDGACPYEGRDCKEWKFDMMTLGDLLDAAGKSLDEVADTADAGGGSYRYWGMGLQVVITYTNRHRFFAPAKDIEYEITVSHIPETEVKFAEFRSRVGDEQIRWQRSAVQISFLQTGTLAHFRWQQLVLSLLEGTIYFGIVTLLCEALAFRLLPERNSYSDAQTDTIQRTNGPSSGGSAAKVRSKYHSNGWANETHMAMASSKGGHDNSNNTYTDNRPTSPPMTLAANPADDTPAASHSPRYLSIDDGVSLPTSRSLVSSLGLASRHGRPLIPSEDRSRLHTVTTASPWRVTADAAKGSSDQISNVRGDPTGSGANGLGVVSSPSSPGPQVGTLGEPHGAITVADLGVAAPDQDMVWA